MKTPRTTRFSISMPEDIVKQLDAMIKSKGYDNRSQAVADMVRHQLVEHKAKQSNEEIAGNITLVYDHHKPNLQNMLTEIQHDFGNMIIATIHVHLDHHNCMEVLSVRGKSQKVQNLSNKLIALKGVKHGALTVTTTGKDFQKH
ncbi:MAG: nickel-responsive transcriptional regulator NikR [bacterium]|nr:nickel-responsive transcriptional regulator NikR [bacterium]